MIEEPFWLDSMLRQIDKLFLFVTEIIGKRIVTISIMDVRLRV